VLGRGRLCARRSRPDDGIEYRLHALSTEAHLDAERLYARCRVVAAATAIHALRHGGQERVVDELLALAR
jgi:hypothetical protein